MTPQITLDLNQVYDYLFCGLMYKYKYQLDFPYLPINAEEIYAESMREALNTLLIGWAERTKSPHVIQSAAASKFKYYMDSKFHNLIRNPARMYELYASGLIVLNTLHRYIDLSHDVVAATHIPYDYHTDNTIVSDYLDAVIIKNDKLRKDRYYSLLTLIDDRSPITSMGKLKGMKVGFARKAFIEILKPKLDRPIMHQFASLYGTIIHPYKTTYKDITILNNIVNNVGYSIKKKLYFPVTHDIKCNYCWYKDICNVKLALDEVPISHQISIAKSLRNKISQESHESNKLDRKSNTTD